MFKTDGAEKRKGKFLKKDSPLYNKVKIQEYNFSEIRKTPVVYPDNIAYNIYFQRLHPEDGFEHMIKAGKTAFSDLAPPNMRMPVIFPRDFTADWMEEKRKAKRRISKGHIDEDELEMALEEEEEEERLLMQAQGHGGDKGEGPKRQPAAGPTLAVSDTSSGQEAKAQTLSPAGGSELKPSLRPPSQQAALEELSQAQGAFSPSAFVGGEASMPLQAEEEAQSLVEAQAALEPEQAKASSEAFDKTPIQGDEAFKEARLKGYDEGLKQGEDKAYRETKAAAQSLLSSLQEGLGELSRLHKDILRKSQHNFYEIASGLSEALLEKAFQAEPRLLKQVIDKAIAEAIHEDSYTIKVHPQFLQALQGLELNDLDSRWQADPQVQLGEFRIESENASLQSDIKGMVKTLLKGADLNLFEAAPATASENESYEDKPEDKKETS